MLDAWVARRRRSRRSVLGVGNSSQPRGRHGFIVGNPGGHNSHNLLPKKLATPRAVQPILAVRTSSIPRTKLQNPSTKLGMEFLLLWDQTFSFCITWVRLLSGGLGLLSATSAGAFPALQIPVPLATQAGRIIAIGHREVLHPGTAPAAVRILANGLGGGSLGTASVIGAHMLIGTSQCGSVPPGCHPTVPPP